MMTPPVLICWVVIGTLLWLTCLIGSIKGSVGAARVFSAGALIAALYGWLPLWAMQTTHTNFSTLRILLTTAAPIAILGTIPFLISAKRQHNAQNQAKQARQDQAEQLLKKFGA